MHYNYVDIGSSNFDYSNHENAKILLVEPLSFYLLEIPNKQNQIKANYAISNYNGKGTVYYIDPKDIEKYNLPVFLTGCNSFNQIHLTAFSELQKNNLTDIYKTIEIDVITFDQLIKLYDISSIDKLKIDTEGHDHVILNDIVRLVEENFIINEIKFEFYRNNYFQNQKDLELILNKFANLKYSWYTVNSDVILTKNLKGY